ncbi:MAG TPA: tripartite tricarboxylate transporter TctB family protein [Burkholderiales bacterium]|nr:tripartite tricarboxylate transporter TctB family protein [Burkholderiales bacterium]
MVSANRLAAGVVVVIAAGLFALTFGFEKMPEGITRGFGAEAFPRLVLGTIIVLACLLAVPSPVSEPAQPRIPKMVYFSSAALVAFMALVPVIGMLPAMLLFLVGLGYLWGERRHWVLLSSAILLTAAIWAVFVKGFGVQLPKGLF